MGKAKTHKQFISEIKELYPYFEILSEYKNRKSNILIRDSRCGHEYTSTPQRIYRGNYCPICNPWNKGKTNNDFIKEVFDMYGNEYTVIGEYKAAKIPIEIKHNSCGNVFKITPTNFLNGRQCPLHKYERSSKSNILPFEKVKEKVFNLVGDEYIIKNYTMMTEKATFIHKKCNSEFEMVASNFVSNGQRCPKCHSSKGEKLIRDYLDSHHIKYEFQKRFDNLIGVNNWKLSYDFYLNDYNTLIEYQGKQHSTPIEYFGGDKKFKIQQEHDIRKREYAKNNNINLLEIWYWDFNNIENILAKELNFEDLVMG